MRGAGRQGQAGAVGARVGARCGLGWQMRAPFWDVGGSVPGWRCRRSERVPTGWVDLGAEAIEPVPERRATGRTQHRRGPEESRQGRTARVAAWGLRHGGPGVRQSVIRTLEGGGGGRGREGGGGGPEESNYVTPQQGLPHTDIAPPLTHRPARPALSPSLAPCPDGPHSPHRPDPAPNVSAPSHEAHRPHRRPQTADQAIQSPADAHRPSLPAGHRRFAAHDPPGNEPGPTEPATGSHCPEPRPTQVCQPYGPAHPRPPHLGAPGPGPIRANRAHTRPSHIRPGSTAALSSPAQDADRAVPRPEPPWVSA